MKHTHRLVRLNLHLRSDHFDRLTTLANALGRHKRRDTRLAEALDLVLTAGLAWEDGDLLGLAKTDREEPCWANLGPIVRSK